MRYLINFLLCILLLNCSSKRLLLKEQDTDLKNKIYRYKDQCAYTVFEHLRLEYEEIKSLKKIIDQDTLDYLNSKYIIAHNEYRQKVRYFLFVQTSFFNLNKKIGNSNITNNRFFLLLLSDIRSKLHFCNTEGVLEQIQQIEKQLNNY